MGSFSHSNSIFWWLEYTKRARNPLENFHSYRSEESQLKNPDAAFRNFTGHKDHMLFSSGFAGDVDRMPRYTVASNCTSVTAVICNSFYHEFWWCIFYIPSRIEHGNVLMCTKAVSPSHAPLSASKSVHPNSYGNSKNFSTYSEDQAQTRETMVQSNDLKWPKVAAMYANKG